MQRFGAFRHILDGSMTAASDAATVAFLQWSLPRLGLRWEGFRNVRGTVRKRLLRRLAELSLRDLDEYRERLESAESEWAVLAGLCRIPISRFHRDRAVFERIGREILPERAEAAERAGRKRLRVWSAGCASGEEPYTIAILWHLDVAPKHPSLAMEVVATDVDETMIARAKRGCYAAGSLRELPPTLRDAAFDRDGLYCVREEVRSSVSFHQQDMRAAMADGPFDVILCRNSAFTYFDEDVQRTVMAGLMERLADGGALIVGTHEIGRAILERLSPRAPCIYERVA
jgi:chemotaxis protein methyltransferase CheR